MVSVVWNLGRIPPEQILGTVEEGWRSLIVLVDAFVLQPISPKVSTHLVSLWSLEICWWRENLMLLAMQNADWFVGLFQPQPLLRTNLLEGSVFEPGSVNYSYFIGVTFLHGLKICIFKLPACYLILQLWHFQDWLLASAWFSTVPQSRQGALELQHKWSI